MRYLFEASKSHQFAIGIELGRNKDGTVSIQLAPVKGRMNPVLAIGMALGVIHSELEKCESPQGQELEGMHQLVGLMHQLVDDEGITETLSDIIGYGLSIAYGYNDKKE